MGLLVSDCQVSYVLTCVGKLDKCLPMHNGYSLDNARRYGWATVTGSLREERKSYFATYLTGKTVLDVGCSAGGYVEHLAGLGFRAIGVEKHEEFLNVAKDEKRGGYVQGDATALPFADKTFDCAYCFDVLEHIDDKIALRELGRVTRQRLILAVPKEDDLLFEFGLTFGHYIDGTHLRYYTQQSLSKLISTVLVNSTFKIFSDIDTPIKTFVQQVLDGHGTYNAHFEFGPSVVLRCVKYAMHDLRNLHVPNVSKCLQRARRSTFLKMLNSVSLEPIHSNLVAVVDLN